MKNVKLKSIMVVFVATFLLIGTQSIAQRGRQGGFNKGYGQGRGYDERPKHQRLFDQLDLTDEQKDKIEGLNLESSKEAIQIQNQMREKEAQLTTLLTQENVEKNKVNNLINEIGKLKSESRKDRVDTHLKIKALLTEKQKIIFDQSQSKRAGRRDYMHQHNRNRWE